jgi:hypothetical protein
LKTKVAAPPFLVSRDIFDFIDIKKDEKLDLEEWV